MVTSLPRIVLLWAAVLLLGGCGDSGPGGRLSSPEDAFRAMQEYVRDGEYDRVWSLLSAEARQEYTRQINRDKETVANAGVNRGEYDRMLEEQFGVDVETFLRSSPETLYGRVIWKGAEQMALFRIVEPARIEGDKATLKLTKEMPAGRGPYPEIELVFVLRSGRWLIAKSPTTHSGPPTDR
jgi:hypothetical protein